MKIEHPVVVAAFQLHTIHSNLHLDEAGTGWHFLRSHGTFTRSQCNVGKYLGSPSAAGARASGPAVDTNDSLGYLRADADSGTRSSSFPTPEAVTARSTRVEASSEKSSAARDACRPKHRG